MTMLDFFLGTVSVILILICLFGVKFKIITGSKEEKHSSNYYVGIADMDTYVVDGQTFNTLDEAKKQLDREVKCAVDGQIFDTMDEAKKHFDREIKAGRAPTLEFNPTITGDTR